MSDSLSKKTGDFLRLGIGLVFFVAFALGKLWMSGFFQQFRGTGGLIDDNSPPLREAIEPEPVVPAPVSGRWSCDWSPTLNENWHDDVLCSRGLEALRPTLLSGSSYVTYDDMMHAAREYEAQLNG